MTSVREYIKSQNELLIGRRVKCIEMKDEYPVPSGTFGTITSIDDIGTLHVKWDDGRTLGLVPNEDIYEVLDKSCQNGLYRECAIFYHNHCEGCPMFK